MIKLTVWVDGPGLEYVYLDPFAVESIRESERRSLYGGSSKIAVLRMRTGQDIVVCDSSRSVGKQFMEATERKGTE